MNNTRRLPLGAPMMRTTTLLAMIAEGCHEAAAVVRTRVRSLETVDARLRLGATLLSYQGIDMTTRDCAASVLA